MNYSIIFVIVGILLILAGILRSIDWYGVFSRVYGNNPTRCKVYVHFGRNVEYIDGDYAYVDEKYVFYTYRYRKQNLAVVIKQSDMDNYGYIRGRVMIHTKFGEGVTALKYTDEKITIGEPEIPARQSGASAIGAVELDASIKSKTAVALVNSVSSRGGLKIMTVILIIAALAGAYLFYNNYQKNKAADENPPVQIEPNDNGIKDQVIPKGS